MVEIKFNGNDDTGIPQFSAYEKDDNSEISVKNWFEKSKNKWHVVLAQNSANRKYIAHNEILKNMDQQTGIYLVEDRTAPARELGTSQPDKKLVPYMNEEDKAAYDEIIARALANRDAMRAASKPAPKTEEEKLLAKYKKMVAKLQALGVTPEA